MADNSNKLLTETHLLTKVSIFLFFSHQISSVPSRREEYYVNKFTGLKLTLQWLLDSLCHAPLWSKTVFHAHRP